MSIVTAKDLSKSYGAQDVFQGLTFAIERGDRIALIGRNGEGKTTLLKLVAGLEEPTAGQVHRTRNLTIGYMPQQAGFPSQRTLWEETLTAFAGLIAQQEELHRLEAAMSAHGGQDPSLLARYGELLEQFSEAGGYAYEAHIRQVLAGLGFDPSQWHEPVQRLSGGEQTRALLSRLLLEEPELLLLDEPTNHLDLQGIEWLEGYLENWRGTLVVVSHDRYFLDRLVTRVWELEFGRLETYSGNYSRYLDLKAERRERQRREWAAQQEKVRRTEEFIRRYGAGQRSREARGRARRLSHLPQVERPREADAISLDLRATGRSGDVVLELLDLEVGYGETALPAVKLLFHVPEARIFRGERVALMGPNGSGKTSLLRTVLGQVPPLKGEFRLGASVSIGYLPQGHTDLNLEETVLENLLAVRNLPLSQARHLLGRYLFSGDDVFKRVGDLSGGEQSRLALARLTLAGANFLILDEPTTHLDIASREVLEEVLDQFAGTILLVSHDRYFVDRLADAVWWLEPGELRVFPGPYHEFQESRRQGPAAGVESGAKEPPRERREAARARRRERAAQARKGEEAQALEDQVARLEVQLASLDVALAEASLAGDLARIEHLARSRRELETLLQQALTAWEEAAAALLEA